MLQIALLSYIIVNLSSKKPTLKTFLTTLVIITTVVFIGKALFSYYEQIQQNILLLSPAKIIASLLLFLVYLYLRALSWKAIVNGLGAKISTANSLYVWFLSESTRFIPGSLWSFASRAYLSRLPRNVTILMVPVEIMFITITTAFLSSHAVIKNLTILPSRIILLFTLAAVIFAILGIFILHKKIIRLLKDLLVHDINIRDFTKALALQFISWTLYGLATIMLIDNLTAPNFLFVFSSTLLAWLIGYLSIIPMGLGVRESAFVLLVGTSVGIPQATLVAVISRIILIMAEIINLALWSSVKRKISTDGQ